MLLKPRARSLAWTEQLKFERRHRSSSQRLATIIALCNLMVSLPWVNILETETYHLYWLMFLGVQSWPGSTPDPTPTRPSGRANESSMIGSDRWQRQLKDCMPRFGNICKTTVSFGHRSEEIFCSLPCKRGSAAITIRPSCDWFFIFALPYPTQSPGSQCRPRLTNLKL